MLKRVLLVVVIGMGLAAAGLAIFFATFKPKQRQVGAAPFERTPTRVERGRYLVEAVLGCMDCHSKHDMTRYGNPAVGLAGAGGDCMGEEQGFPGKVCMSNITPEPETGLGAWSDEEILRAIREGVDREGKGLFPLMPYTVYKALSDEDGRSVVAYLRTLPPAKNAVPPQEVKFPMSFILKMAPQPLAGPVPNPDRNDRVAYGRYLATVSGCQFCHTPVDNMHQAIAGQEFSGGQPFKGPWGTVNSANLTPHATGLGDRSEQAFVGMFKAFAIPADQLPVVPPSANTTMPWLTRAQMSEADLGAIYAFLKTVPAIERVVEKRPAPKLPDAAAPPPPPAGSGSGAAAPTP